MSSRFAAFALALVFAVFGLSDPLHAQGVTGQLGGTVTDSTGAVLPGVTVVAKNVNTNATRETLTGARGEFLFPDLLAGTFDLTASLEGFKTYEQKGIVVNSTDRVQLRAISLDVGGLTETISVQAEAVQVQTTSGARQSLVTRQNFEDIALKGRDFAGMLKVLPGVIDTSVRERSRLGEHERHHHQRAGELQLHLRRRDEQGHGAEPRELLRAGARFDRGSPGAVLELQRRVRPQLGCDDQRHHPQRYAATSTAAPRSTSATTR